MTSGSLRREKRRTCLEVPEYQLETTFIQPLLTGARCMPGTVLGAYDVLVNTKAPEAVGLTSYLGGRQ